MTNICNEFPGRDISGRFLVATLLGMTTSIFPRCGIAEAMP
jgi:hypothetical protein